MPSLPMPSTILCLLITLMGALPFTLPESEDYSDAKKKAEEDWSEWAREALTGRKVEKSYAPMSVAGKRVLILYPRGSSKSKIKSVSTKTVAAFDKLFDPKQREAGAPSRKTAVLFPLSGTKSFTAITARAAELVPRLTGWAQSAPKAVGFLLEDPLSAGWLKNVPENEVWSEENELSNRLARLLTLERFGRQPHWLSQGIAWHVELGVCKDVYCFPFRSGFVSKKEHKAWPKRLPELMSSRGEIPLATTDLLGWSRDTWQADRATLAWGAVAMLAKHYPDEFPHVLTAFRDLRVNDGRSTAEDGSWTVIPDYEIPVEPMVEILDRKLGVDFMVEFDRYARKPKAYRRPR
jgi:hypothetical protein